MSPRLSATLRVSRPKVIVRNTFIHVETEETKMNGALAKKEDFKYMRWFLVESI